jgi:4'-phosphopantetheinyl transferase
MEQRIVSLYANWKVLEQKEVFRHFFSKLSGERREKIGGIKHCSSACQSLGGWTLVDQGLQMLCGFGEARAKIIYGPKGKPDLDDGGWHFNISHSGDYVMAAFAPMPVGCDIQKKEERRANVAKRFFAQTEQQRLAEGADFFEIWTKKESFIKLSGKGMSMDLTAFDIFNIQQTMEDCRFASKSLPGYELAVCYQNADSLSVEWIPVELGSFSGVLP